jgi:hypothetical protein
VAASSCGGTAEREGGGTSPAPTAEEACASFEAARCERLATCTDDLLTTLRYGDRATCEARGRIACLAALEAEGTSATPASLGSCAASIAAEACDDFLSGAVPDACEPAPGARATGASCLTSGQCASTYCAVQKNALCGVCAEPPRAGDPCALTDDCGRELVCSKAGICAALVLEGDACDDARPCAPRLACTGPAGATSCQPTLTTEGAECDPQAHNAPDCDRVAGLYCAPKTKTCERALLAAAGEPCGLVEGRVSVCTGGALCAGASAGEPGVCLAPAADDAACDDKLGPPCALPARCVTPDVTTTAGTCRAPDAALCP